MSLASILSATIPTYGGANLAPQARAPITPIKPVQRQTTSAPDQPQTNNTRPPDAAPPVDRTYQEPDRVELSPRARAGQQLTEEQQERVTELQEKDRRIRDHEAAHLAAAGQYARGGAQYEYETGPDGKQYAVAGEVQIDVSPIDGDPEATIRKMEVVRAAALAPADPSPQDQQVAAQAMQQAQTARAELAQQQTASPQASQSTEAPSADNPTAAAATPGASNGSTAQHTSGLAVKQSPPNATEYGPYQPTHTPAPRQINLLA